MTDPPPLHEGWQQLTTNWSLELPFPMARRVEDGALCFWHSPRKFTCWLNIWTPPNGNNARAQLETLKLDCSPEAFDQIEEESGSLLRYAYRLDESAENGVQPALYGFVVASNEEYVLLSAYFDHAKLLTDALSMWRSLRWNDDRQ